MTRRWIPTGATIAALLLAIGTLAGCPTSLESNPTPGFCGENTALSSGDSCSFAGTCSLGTECCCGVCYDSVICTCSNGVASCYPTKACQAGCSDVSASDSVSSDTGTTDVAPPQDAAADTNDASWPDIIADIPPDLSDVPPDVPSDVDADLLDVADSGPDADGDVAEGDAGDASNVPDGVDGQSEVVNTDGGTIDSIDPGDATDATSNDATDTGAETTLGPGQCQSQSDCSGLAGLCWAPDESFPCGICFTPPDTCTDDTSCKANDATTVCGPLACACGGESACTEGCNGDDSFCDVGESCAADGHCVPTECVTAGDCPENFSCGSQGCARTACTATSDCIGYCVKGFCHDVPGYCSPPPG